MLQISPINFSNISKGLKFPSLFINCKLILSPILSYAQLHGTKWNISKIQEIERNSLELAANLPIDKYVVLQKAVHTFRIAEIGPLYISSNMQFYANNAEVLFCFFCYLILDVILYSKNLETEHVDIIHEN